MRTNSFSQRLVRLCTWQAVICLFVACLILWLYILPSASYYAFSFVNEKTTVNFISRFYPPSQIRLMLELSENIKIQNAAPRLMIGLIEDVTLFFFMFSFYVALLPNESIKCRSTFAIVLLVLVGFASDLLQSIGMICSMFFPPSKALFLVLISFLFFTKIIVYSISLTVIITRKLRTY